MRSIAGIVALSAALALPAAARAFIISPVYATPDQWTTDEMSVITQAADDWSSRLALDSGNNQNINVVFRMVHEGNSFLAEWQPNGASTAFAPYSASVEQDIYVNADFFPMESISLAAPTPDAGKYDFLTIIRHELGHAMGFYTGLYRDDAGTDRFGSHISDGIFDPGGLNVPMYSDNNHLSLPDDLMYFSLNMDTRKPISTTDLNILALAYGDSIIPVPEPASLSLLTLATPVLLRRRRRTPTPFHLTI